MNSIPSGVHLDADGRALPGTIPATRRRARKAVRPPCILLGHIGDADDIAWGAVYLASDQAKFVTGAELVIDGGYTAR